ncbi:tetratricopeptide repeat protein 21B-like isoform X2 [Vespa crabro]|uniref:tetratricopeptide repeat protein 21B-like isoform X2 n=1 Tax=Vespa crabro TaxID=7445 RepID=UPI001F013633|nr:tetratricopeptide repeat protein 21B-like isoform X2 [Vespa crabro]
MEEQEYITWIEWMCHQFYYNEMLNHVKEACDAYPTSDHLKLLLSLTYLLNGRIHDAIKESGSLMNNTEVSLPGLLIQSFAHKVSTNGDKSAIMQIDVKIREERRKASATALSLSALILLLYKKIDKAKDYADRAYKVNPVDTNVLLAKGWVELYVKEDNHTKMDYFDIVLKTHSRHFNALMGTARYKQYCGDHTGAISILNSLIVHYPKLSFPLVEKLANQLAMKDWEQVLETANRILTIDPNNLDAIKAHCVVALCKDGEYNESLKHLQLFLRNLILVEAKNIDLLVRNIKLFSSIGCRNENILMELCKVTEKMLQQNSNCGELMVELGNLYVLLGKTKEAEHWYRNNARIEESSFPALIGLAHCQLLDNSANARVLARQQIDFLMEIQSTSVSPKLLFMSSILCEDDKRKGLEYLNMAAKVLLKDCEYISYGYEYLTNLNPDLCMEIGKERLTYSVHDTSSMDEGSSEGKKEPLLDLLEKLAEACPGLTNVLLILSKIEMQSGKLEKAQTILRKLLDSVDSTNAQGHLLMAQILAYQGHYQLALQSLEVGLSYNFKVRDDPIYHVVNGIIQKENGDFENCIKSFELAMLCAGLKRNKNITEVNQISMQDKAMLYLELISAYSKMKQFSEALALMEDAIIVLQGTGEESKATIGYADLYLEMGELEKAIEHLAKVKPDEPYYVQAHTKLAQIHLKYKRDRQAFAKCFRELVENCPGPNTYSMLGDAYISIQEPERAIEAYEQALNQNPKDKAIIANKMGKALIKTHQYMEAISYYKDMIKEAECKDLKLDLAKLFIKMKQYDRAEATLLEELRNARFESDLESLESRGQQLLLLAKVREKAGNIQAALSVLKEAKESQTRYIQRLTMGSSAIEQKHVVADICVTMADHASSIRDYDQAVLYYKEALSYKPADIKALLSLAKLYMQINNLDKCAQTCTTLLKADPNNVAASVMMADLAFRKVDFETAAFHFRQLLLQKPMYWTALARLIEVSRRTGNMDDLYEWLSQAQTAMESNNMEAGFYYCTGLLDWRMGRLNSALRNFNYARRDPEWGQQAIYNMIEICLDPDDDSSLSNEAFNDEDTEYQDSRTMALKTAYRLLQELNPRGSQHEMLTHRLLGNFFLLATKQKSNIEKALQDCTNLASQEALRDHVGPALGMATAHILLKQTPRARNHLKRVSKNVWTFEDAEYLERCWLLLADIYVQSSKYDLANELLKRVLQHNATCVRAHELSGYIAEKEQNYREASLRYAQAWKFGGKSKLSIGYKLAYCSFKGKSYADAIEACNEVLRQNSDYPRIRKDVLEKAINNLRT